MASIYKRGKVWWISYYLGKKHVRKRVGHDEEQAKILQKEVEYKLVAKQVEMPVKKIKLDEYQSMFFRIMTPYLTAKTITNYVMAIGIFTRFLEKMNITHISDITQGLIEEYIADRKSKNSLRTGESISESTINTELKIIKRYLSKAEELNYIYKNPAHWVKFLKTSKKNQMFFSPEQIKAIFDSKISDNDKFIYAGMLLTGMRPGEVINLQWNDINFDTREILIKEKKGWSPKNRIERNIPMSNELFHLLKRISKPGLYVFLNSAGRKYTLHGLEVNFSRLMLKLKIIGATPHTFRHTFASIMLMKFGNIRAVQEILGHSSIKTTEIYTHSSREHLSSIIKEYGMSLCTVLCTVTQIEGNAPRLTE